MARQPTSVAAAVTRFGVAGLVAVTALGGLILFAVSRISTAEALRSAQDRARLAGYGIVEPSLRNELLGTDTDRRMQALRAVDDVIQARVLSSRVLRVKLWTSDGLIVYSDEPELVGTKFPPKEDHREAIRTGEIRSEQSSTNAPENMYERDSGRLLEVYLPVRAPDGTTLVYEQYERYDSVVGNANQLLRRLALPLGAGLALLWLTQLPLARSLAKRVYEAEAEQVSLLEHAVTASERERERIAADLHDGTVQQLAGLTFELSAAAANEPSGPTRDSFDRSAAIARIAMQRLRATLVDLHPPTIDAVGLSSGIESLTEPLRTHGVRTHLDVQLDDLGRDQSALLYRVAQELIRNVEEHANAQNMSVRGTRVNGMARLVVTDDGRGFDDAIRAERRDKGHLGLELHEALVQRLGGSLTLMSSPKQGTVATVEIPA
jgi:two-component system, NarL family, sensor kinase